MKVGKRREVSKHIFKSCGLAKIVKYAEVAYLRQDSLARDVQETKFQTREPSGKMVYHKGTVL